MAKLNYYLDTRAVKKDGKCPLKLVVNTRQGSFLLNTGISLKTEEWNPSLRIIVLHPQRKFLNSHLSAMMVRSENVLLDEQRKVGHVLQKPQVKQVLSEIWCERASNNDGAVYTIFKKVIHDESRRKRTRELYEATWHKIQGYVGENTAQCLMFEDITVDWLEGFECWLMPDCPSANARAIHFRNLRSVFNIAIDEGVTEIYPFRRFSIKQQQTRKRSLSVEQLRWLHETPLNKYQKKYVDVFFLMFYLMGINAVDLLTAKPSQIVGGRLEYTRSKTGTLYSVKLEPEAIEIIHRYKGKKHLLRFCDKVQDYRNWMKRFNKCLDDLIPGCTSYYARHSVATIAAELDVPMDTIARMLGHTDPSLKITLVYVDFNQKKVDEANRKVIDHVLYNK
ncbi:MAG: site-specific integrase [Bacteroidaceae bacterium]|nr:site-specific integrase [Bacteroidaceae bacterium]